MSKEEKKKILYCFRCSVSVRCLHLKKVSWKFWNFKVSLWSWRWRADGEMQNMYSPSCTVGFVVLIPSSCHYISSAALQSTSAVLNILLLLLFECSLTSFKLNEGIAFRCTFSELNAVLWIDRAFKAASVLHGSCSLFVKVYYQVRYLCRLKAQA